MFSGCIQPFPEWLLMFLCMYLLFLNLIEREGVFFRSKETLLAVSKLLRYFWQNIELVLCKYNVDQILKQLQRR